jgi:L-aspartate oxidase
MATAALLVATAALARTESRGAHYRADFPAENPQLAARSMTTLAQARDRAAASMDAKRPLQPHTVLA